MPKHGHIGNGYTNTTGKPRRLANVFVTEETEIVELWVAPKIKLNFRLDQYQYDFIKKEARRLKWTMSDVVRAILDLYMDATDKMPEMEAMDE